MFAWFFVDGVSRLKELRGTNYAYHRKPATVWAAVKEKCRAWYEREMLRNATESLLIDGPARPEISTLAQANPSAGELRRRMLATLGLDHAAAARAWPGIMRAVGRVCVTCNEPGRCRRWLDSGAADDGFRDFCPNARQLDGLKILQARRTRSLSVH
jgi:hypothetical protein